MRAQVTTEISPQNSRTRESGPPTEWLALLECATPSPRPDRLSRLIRDSFNWPLFLQSAEHHGLTLLLAERVRDLDRSLVPPQALVKLQELQRTHAVSALQLTAELFRVLHRFTVSGINVLLTKGPALSVRCYGKPDMRQYGDLDLIVREADMRRATQAMIDLAYEPRIPLSAIDAKKSPGEYVFRKPGTNVLIEFHTERTFRYHPRRLPIEKLFQRRALVAIDGRDVPALSLEDELILICVHGAKHFWERLMWIADVAALISAKQAPDWSRAMAAAREVGAERILRLGLRLAADVLGAQLPAQPDASVQSDRTVAKLASQIQNRLVLYEPREIGVMERAAFRMRMRGGLFAGAAYLLRLSLSPTEEDWTQGKEGNRPAFIDAVGRPLRLAKKHSRRSNN
jgi:predicted component of type VI protein secretion system